MDDSGEIISPRNMLAILTGAHEWPRSNFGASPQFLRSAKAIRDYFLADDGLGMAGTQMLDLFDSDLGAAEQIIEIGEFIESYRKAENSIDAIFVYYVGHGGFMGPDNDYFLALRETRKDYEYATGLRVKNLADCLKAKARHVRRYIVLDCCFSGTAQALFQSEQAQAAARKTAEAMPRRGTAILCSSSSYDPSKAPRDAEMTMFSGALHAALRRGSSRIRSLRMSFTDVYDLTWESIRDTHEDEGVRPELHVPDQRSGNIANVPFFPNPGYRRSQVEDKPEQEDRNEDRAPSPAKRKKIEPAPVKMALLLSSRSEKAIVGEKIDFIVTLRNDGDLELNYVVVTHDRSLLEPPFRIDPGRGRRFRFSRNCDHAGVEEVTVEAHAVASDGREIHSRAEKKIAIEESGRMVAKSRSTQPPDQSKPAAGSAEASRDTTISTRPSPPASERDRLKVFIQEHSREEMIPCPLCKEFVRAGKLLLHYDRKCRAKFLGNRTASPSFKKKTKPDPPKARFPVLRKPAEKTAQATSEQNGSIRKPPQPQPSSQRDQLKAFLQKHSRDEMIACPLCKVSVKAVNLLQHYDRKCTGDKTKELKIPSTHAKYTLKGLPDFLSFDLGESLLKSPPATSKPGGVLKTPVKPRRPAAREPLKASVQKRSPDARISCPLCKESVSDGDLVRHYVQECTANKSKERKISSTHGNKAGEDLSKAQFPKLSELFQSTAPSTPWLGGLLKTPVKSKPPTGRDQIKALMQKHDRDEMVPCPLCKASVRVNNLLLHYDWKCPGK